MATLGHKATFELLVKCCSAYSVAEFRVELGDSLTYALAKGVTDRNLKGAGLLGNRID